MYIVQRQVPTETSASVFPLVRDYHPVGAQGSLCRGSLSDRRTQGMVGTGGGHAGRH